MIRVCGACVPWAQGRLGLAHEKIMRKKRRALLEDMDKQNYDKFVEAQKQQRAEQFEAKWDEELAWAHQQWQKETALREHKLAEQRRLKAERMAKLSARRPVVTQPSSSPRKKAGRGRVAQPARSAQDGLQAKAKEKEAEEDKKEQEEKGSGLLPPIRPGSGSAGSGAPAQRSPRRPAPPARARTSMGTRKPTEALPPLAQQKELLRSPAAPGAAKPDRRGSDGTATGLGFAHSVPVEDPAVDVAELTQPLAVSAAPPAARAAGPRAPAPPKRKAAPQTLSEYHLGESDPAVMYRRLLSSLSCVFGVPPQPAQGRETVPADVAPSEGGPAGGGGGDRGGTALARVVHAIQTRESAHTGNSSAVHDTHSFYDFHVSSPADKLEMPLTFPNCFAPL